MAACCFTLAAILFTGQVWVDYAYAGRSLSWPRAFAVALVDWELWTLIAPVVLLLAARVPLSRRRLARPLAVHIPASLGIAAVKLVAEGMIVRAIIGPGRVPFSLLKIHLTVLTYWAIVAAVQYAEQQRLSRERELRAARLQTELARAQVESLKMQIHPHFLFNTLNAIAGLMREDVESADVDAGAAERAAARHAADRRRAGSAARRGAAAPARYLAIQQTRFGDRLRIDVDVAAGCEAGLVPTLILQPLVENAIRHGFSATPGPGAVGDPRVVRAGDAAHRRHRRGPGPAAAAARRLWPPEHAVAPAARLYGDDATLSVGPDAAARRPRAARPPAARGPVVMSLRVLIVDDEPLARRTAEGAARGARRPSTSSARARTASRRWPRSGGCGPDLVFLDVQMPGLDGFDVIELLSKAGGCPAVIFVTAYDRYAMRAFDVHAVDYLLKPFERGRLRKALARAAALAGSADNPARLHALVDAVRAAQPLRRFLVKSPGRVYAVRVDDVESLEAAGHYVEFRTAGAAPPRPRHDAAARAAARPRPVRPHPPIDDRQRRQGDGAAAGVSRRIRGRAVGGRRRCAAAAPMRRS